MKQHVNLSIIGKVQGVFFRHHTKEIAESLGIYGYVTNRPDGSVYIEAEGEEDILNSFIEWCSHGPTRAQVEYIDKSYSPSLEYFSTFTIT